MHNLLHSPICEDRKVDMLLFLHVRHVGIRTNWCTYFLCAPGGRLGLPAAHGSKLCK
jgi:hypothetical protein